ncbi:MAG: alpha/beta fold hydrolase, partial [Acidimicrobiales bacterium]
MTTPTLILGHPSDRLHPLGDAARLAAQLPNARFVEARSILELRLRPARLTAEIIGFLEDAWETGHASRTVSEAGIARPDDIAAR